MRIGQDQVGLRHWIRLDVRIAPGDEFAHCTATIFLVRMWADPDYRRAVQVFLATACAWAGSAVVVAITLTRNGTFGFAYIS